MYIEVVVISSWKDFLILLIDNVEKHLFPTNMIVQHEFQNIKKKYFSSYVELTHYLSIMNSQWKCYEGTGHNKTNNSTEETKGTKSLPKEISHIKIPNSKISNDY